MLYTKTTNEALLELETTRQGLSSQQAAVSREQHGVNEIPQKRRKTAPEVFLSQFADLLVLILIVSAIISFLSGNADSAAVILCVIILNAALGTYQHFKAEKSLDSLKKMSAPNARVMRDGAVAEIPAAEIAVGDVVLLEAGNIVAADGRVIESAGLTVNESSLTGESTTVTKSTDKIDGAEIPLGDRVNMVYGGSLVTGGRGIFAVSAVGASTEIGRIATLINKAQKRKTPLQVSLDKLGRTLSIIILIICALVFGLSLMRGESILNSLTFAVALAVAAIPEALSSIVTISLALGTQKMARQHAIMKDLRAVEGLGGVSVICSDKTGTLTQNKMTVRGIYFDGTELWDGEELGGETEREGCCLVGEKALSTPQATSVPDSCELLKYAFALCNDSVCVDGAYIGDPTETALPDYIGGDCYEKTRAAFARVSELPFDSERKAMSTLNAVNGENLMFTKGAADVLLPRCTHIMSHGAAREITDADREEIVNACDRYSDKGMRVLFFAYKRFDGDKLALSDESGLCFIGLAAMTDPPREESKAAVADCLRAGIKPVMITGDHKATAVAIAREIGIFSDGDIALNGTELDKISDEELSEMLPRVSVYARVAPEHKIRIVELWQQRGNIVSMTGDGVNDAPALKKADIGVAMGITGTEVSKDAASMILADDNFATIIKAVANGRAIFRNIRNAVKYLISGNTAGIISVLYASVLGLPMPFSAVQLLFINLVTDSLPAIAIGMEPPDRDVLSDKPRKLSEGILDRHSLLSVLLQGLLLAAASICSYSIGLACCPASAGTMAFITLCLGRLFAGFSFRGNAPIHKLGFKSNPFSLLAFAAGALFLAVSIAIPPLHALFDIVPPSPAFIGIAAGVAAVPCLIVQLWKIISWKQK